jgi:hypothetical protein
MVRPCVTRGFVDLASAVLHQCIRSLIGARCAPDHPITGHWQRERFRSQRRIHRISRFYWQRRYGIFVEVPNSYRTWIKASAGASNTSRDTFALQSISPTSREVAATFLPHLALGMQDYFSGETPIARSETPQAYHTQADRL